MLELDQVTSEWGVILAMSNMEEVKLLAVILDGFGYLALECLNSASLMDQLSRTTPFAAIIDTQVAEAKEMCDLIKERGDISLLVLIGDLEGEPEERVTFFGADEWEAANAGPEKILTHLKRFAAEKIEPAQVPH